MYDTFAIPSPDPLPFLYRSNAHRVPIRLPVQSADASLLLFPSSPVSHTTYSPVRRVCFATSQASPVFFQSPVLLPNSLLSFLPAVFIPGSLNCRNNILCFLCHLQFSCLSKAGSLTNGVPLNCKSHPPAYRCRRGYLPSCRTDRSGPVRIFSAVFFL